MKTYTIEEIERMLEGPHPEIMVDDNFILAIEVIRQLLAERSQIRKMTFMEASGLVDRYSHCASDLLRRKAEEE